MAVPYRALRIQGGVRPSHRERTVVPRREWALPGRPVSKTTVASLVSGLVYLHLNTARVFFLYRTVSLSLPSSPP
jgi:hypothetical protein